MFPENLPNRNLDRVAQSRSRTCTSQINVYVHAPEMRVRVPLGTLCSEAALFTFESL